MAAEEPAAPPAQPASAGGGLLQASAPVPLPDFTKPAPSLPDFLEMLSQQRLRRAVMGLLDFSGFVGDDTTKDEFGLTQADRRQPLFTGLLKAGMLGMAAGENITPGQRAQLMGQIGGAIGDIPKGVQDVEAAGAQMQLRRQQFATNKQKLDQQRKLQAYAQTPEFAEMSRACRQHIQFGLNDRDQGGRRRCLPAA